jgi:glucose/arabinose dehydrogenase/PKD repeat protein
MIRALTAAAAAAFTACFAPAAALAVPSIPSDLEAHTIASGLQAPTAVAFAPDGRAFIAEKQGTVKVVLPSEAPRARLLIDISDHVATHVDRGLLGIAVDSDFAHNGYIYLLYTYDSDQAQTAAPKTNRLTRIKVGDGANVVGGEHVVLGSSGLSSCPAPGPGTDCLPSDGFSHRIGTVRADPDGTLWVGVGDGVTPGSTSPTIMRALDPNVMSGAILHVDRDGRGVKGHPFCPKTTDLTRSCTKIYSKGFRNPFRFSLLGDGRVAVGDVGYNAWEEIDLIKGGRSYGWPCREANHPTPGYATTPACRAVKPASQTAPTFEYAHTSLGGAVMAGPLLGPDWPARARGMLSVGDYAQGTISTLDTLRPVLGLAPLLNNLDSIVDLTAAPNGGVAIVEAGFTASGLEPGRVWVLSPAGQSQRPWLKPSASVSGLTVNFDGHAQDADTSADHLTWQWDFGDGSSSTDAAPSHSFAAAGTYSVTVTVSDGTESANEVLPVTVGLAAPDVTISQPLSDSKVVGGSTVQLRGSATVDGVAVPASGLIWTVLLHHHDHIHYLTGFSGAVGSFVAPTDHDADSWYDIKLKAVTAEGRTGSSRLRLDPKTRTLTLATSPAGISPGFGGIAGAGPRTTAVGYAAALSVPATATISGKRWKFSKWSDGSKSASRSFSMPDSDTTLTAIYARG